MDRLRCIEVFVEVARDGSFTGAARRLGMSKGTATKHVAWLEQSLGAKLLNRTTKHVGLTEAGAQALSQGKLLLDGYEEIGAGARDLVRKPRGIVRVGTPPSFGTHHLLPLVARFTERYPGHPHHAAARRRQRQSDHAGPRSVGPHRAGARGRRPYRGSAHQGAAGAGGVEGLSAAARRAADRPPISPHHNCLVHALKSPTNIWRFTCAAGEVSTRVRGTVSSNFGEALKQAALLGHGISMHPYYMVSDDLKAEAARGRAAGLRAARARYLRGLSDREHLPCARAGSWNSSRRWARTPPDWAVSNAR